MTTTEHPAVTVDLRVRADPRAATTADPGTGSAAPPTVEHRVDPWVGPEPVTVPLPLAPLAAAARSRRPAAAPVRTLRAADLYRARPDLVLAAAGLAAIAALVPVAGSWAVQPVLLALVLTVPGVLLLRALEVPRRLTLPLTVPAALLVLLASGLALNTLGPVLGDPYPLQTGPVLLALEVVGVALLGIVVWRTDALDDLGTVVVGLVSSPRHGRFARTVASTDPVAGSGWTRLLTRWDLLLPALVPAVTVIGALRLNSADSGAGSLAATGVVHAGTIAVVAAVLMGIALVGGLVLAPRTDDLALGATLYTVGLATLWSFSLRAEAIFGYDVMTEYRKMIETVDAGWWNSFRPGDAYGAMLSVTILPAQLHELSGVSVEILIKILFPAVFAVCPVIVYAVCRRFLQRRWAFLGAALLVVQPNFGQQMPGLAKQEIGFTLFAALLLVLVARFPSTWAATATRAALVVGLAMGVVVTHYSSAYFGVVLLGAGTGVLLVASAILRRRQRVGFVALAFLVILLGAGLWNSTITHSSSNVSEAMTGFEVNGFSLLPNRGVDDDLLTGYIKGNTTPTIPAPEYQQLVTSLYEGTRPWVRPVPDAADPRWNITDAPVGDASVSIPALLAGFAASQVAYAMAAVAGFVLTLRRRSSPTERLVGAMVLGGVGALGMLRLSGTLAAAYNQDRALLQALMVLVVGVGWTAQWLAMSKPGWKRWRPRLAAGGAVVIIGVLFALNSSLLPALGGNARINLAGGGEDFQRFYSYRSEVVAARWIGDRIAPQQMVYADRYGTLRFLLGTGRQVGVFPEIVPRVIDKSAWIYATSANTREDAVRSQTLGKLSVYRFPSEFLDQHFDVVYTNGTSTVYHR